MEAIGAFQPGGACPKIVPPHGGESETKMVNNMIPTVVNKIAPTMHEIQSLIFAASQSAQETKAARENNTLKGNALAASLLDALLLGSLDLKQGLTNLVSKDSQELTESQKKTLANNLGYAKRVYREIINSDDGFLVVCYAKEEIEHKVTRFYEENLNILLDVRKTAQKYKKIEEAANSVSKQEQDYILLACQDDGITTPQDVNKMSAIMRDKYIARGKTIHELNNSPQTKIRALLATLTEEEKAELLKAA